jgi:hypothetical protein
MAKPIAVNQLPQAGQGASATMAAAENAVSESLSGKIAHSQPAPERSSPRPPRVLSDFR